MSLETTLARIAAIETALYPQAASSTGGASSAGASSATSGTSSEDFSQLLGEAATGSSASTLATGSTASLLGIGSTSGSAAAMPDVLNGTIPIIVDVATFALPFVQKGETRALAVMDDRRLPQLPDVPTTAEAGFPDLIAYTWHMVMAPSGAPEAAISAANAAFNRAAAMPAVQQRLTDLAMRVISDSTPASATDWLRKEMAKWEGLIREANIRVD